MLPDRIYFTAISTVGLGLVGIALVTFNVGELTVLGLLLFLTILTAWLRIKVEPFGRVTLVPLLVFVALLLASPSIAILLGAISALVGSRFFARNSWVRTLTEVGEEAICTFAASLAVWSQRTLQIALDNPIFMFSVAVLLYTFAKILVTMIAGYAREGIPSTIFILGSGRFLFAHHIFLGAVALALAFLNRQFGVLAIPLATIALAESYYPSKLVSDQRDVLFSSLTMIAHAIDLKDIYTGKHARQVSDVAVRVARQMRLPEGNVRAVRIAGLLHDIGKIGISGSIIRKPGRLTPEEEAAMKRHPVIGADIMQPVELLTNAAYLVRHHHERYDGTGYPDGLKGEDIPIGSRIVFVADAFNAMTTDRPYRRARTKAEAFQVLKEYAGRQFDSRVVEALGSILDVI